MRQNREQRICNIQYCLLQAMNMFVAAVLSAFLVPLLQSQGFSTWQIGVLIAVKCCATIVFSPMYASVADRISDRVSNKAFIVIFCAVGIVFSMLHMWCPLNFGGAVVIFLGYGASFNCIGTFVDSMSSQYKAHGVEVHYAFARAMGSLFWAMAGLILGYLTTGFSTDAVLWLQMASLVLCMAVALWSKDPNRVGDGSAQTAARRAQDGVSTLYAMLRQNTFYTWFLIAGFFLMTGVNMTMSYMAYTVSDAGGGNFELGVTSFLLGFFEVFVGCYFGFFHKKLGTECVILLAMLGMTLRVAMLVTAVNIPMVYAAQGFELIGCMLWAGNVQLVEDFIPPADRVKGQTVVSAVQTGLAALSSSLLGGFLLDVFQSAFSVHIIALCLCVLGVAIYFVAAMKQRHHASGAAPQTAPRDAASV